MFQACSPTTYLYLLVLSGLSSAHFLVKIQPNPRGDTGFAGRLGFAGQYVQLRIYHVWRAFHTPPTRTTIFIETSQHPKIQYPSQYINPNARHHLAPKKHNELYPSHSPRLSRALPAPCLCLDLREQGMAHRASVLFTHDHIGSPSRLDTPGSYPRLPHAQCFQEARLSSV